MAFFDVHLVVITSYSRVMMLMEIYSGNIVTDKDLCCYNESPKDHLQSSKWTVMTD